MHLYSTVYHIYLLLIFVCLTFNDVFYMICGLVFYHLIFNLDLKK